MTTIRLSEKNLETIIRVLWDDLSNAQDNVARAEMQQKRMTLDHGSNAALDRYREWQKNTEQALMAVGVRLP